MPFPLFKLGYLAIRQISKPLASAIKQKAKTSPFLRNKILLPPAQLYHYFDTTVKMRLMGLGKVSNVKPLNEEMAIDLAADMLGETVIFTVASVTILFEYLRASKKDQYKEQMQNERLQSLEASLKDMELLLDEQDAKIRALSRVVESPPQRTGSGAASTASKPSATYTIKDPKTGTILTVEPG